MCHTGSPIGRVRLTRCQHETYRLNLENMTLHLTAREMLMIGQAINRWVQAHPQVLAALDEGDWNDMQRNIWIT